MQEGNYQKDHLNKSATLVHAIEAAAGHPILHGIPTSDFRVSGTLYKNDPLPTTAAPLMLGHVEGSETVEPVAWTHQRPNGGRVFYTSLGHPDTFELPEFQRLLRNATYWVADLPIPASR